VTSWDGNWPVEYALNVNEAAIVLLSFDKLYKGQRWTARFDINSCSSV